MWAVRTFLLALAALGMGEVVTAAKGKLSVGEIIPPLAARTLDDVPVTVPGQGSGRSVVVVIGFSKDATKATRPWLERCRAASASTTSSGPAPRCLDVRMLEEVPRMLRGMIERTMRRGLPPELRQDVLLVYDDNASWRERLGVVDADVAYAVAFDRQGRIHGLAAGAASSTAVDELVRTLGE